MNCKQGDLAIIKTTHPHKYLHGVICTCKEWIGVSFGFPYTDVWMVTFSNPQRSDAGVMADHGEMRDYYLRPIRPAEEPETVARGTLEPLTA